MAKDTHNTTETSQAEVEKTAQVGEEVQYEAQPFIDLPSMWDRL